MLSTVTCYMRLMLLLHAIALSLIWLYVQNCERRNDRLIDVTKLLSDSKPLDVLAMNLLHEGPESVTWKAWICYIGPVGYVWPQHTLGFKEANSGNKILHYIILHHIYLFWLVVSRISLCTTYYWEEDPNFTSTTHWMGHLLGKVPIYGLPSGEHTKSYGKSTHFSWENPLFQWPFSIAILTLPEAISVDKWDLLLRYHMGF